MSAGLIEKYLEYVRVERRLAARTVELYAIHLKTLAEKAEAAGVALDHPPQRTADVALILGNRAYRDGKPNPCLTGRVDAGLALAA